MGGSWSSSSSSSSSSEKRVGSEMALPKAKDIVASTPSSSSARHIVPTAIRFKQLLAQLGANFKAIELDVESDGSEIQSALLAWTGQRTVPNVFIGGKHIGGCDTVTAKHNEGKLVPLLTEAGALATAAA
uniref:Glutaredoxin domain-containing protein n=1 Tax=Ananas comosus var. bracteatus TaxID=296719 RepID=A0A6V7Q589_ANACO|nr:unnamed protein product [Ananas comosus var. bracteatus]